MSAGWDPGEAASARALWDALADDYDRRHGDDGNDWHRLLIEPGTLALLGDVHGKRVLDLGCGTGVLARRLLRSGARVVGVDGSAEFLERARRRPGGESIEWGVVDALDEDAIASLGPFDAVVCTMLMDLPDVGPLFRGARRVLHRGPLVVTTAHPSFNRPDATFWSESGEDASGAAWHRGGLKLSAYATPYRQHALRHAGPSRRRSGTSTARCTSFSRPPSKPAWCSTPSGSRPSRQGRASRFGPELPPVLVMRLSPAIRT